MSTEAQDQMEMGTKPVQEHEWLQKLVGEWTVESKMTMEDGENLNSVGTVSVKSLGGLWAFSETKEKMPDGTEMISYFTLGYDVSFKEYRGGWFSSASSHLWKYVGELSADGKTMTLNCEGPNMEIDGETALYRDVIELIDENTRTQTSYWQQNTDGEWLEAMKATYTRI